MGRAGLRRNQAVETVLSPFSVAANGELHDELGEPLYIVIGKEPVDLLGLAAAVQDGWHFWPMPLDVGKEFGPGVPFRDFALSFRELHVYRDDVGVRIVQLQLRFVQVSCADVHDRNIGPVELCLAILDFLLESDNHCLVEAVIVFDDEQALFHFVHVRCSCIVNLCILRILHTLVKRPFLV